MHVHKVGVVEDPALRERDEPLAALLLLLAELDRALHVALLRRRERVRALLALLDRLPQVLLLLVLPLPLAVYPICVLRAGPPVLRKPIIVLVVFVGVDRGPAEHAVAHAGAGGAFLEEAAAVEEEVGDVFGFLADVGALVAAVVVDVLELAEGFDHVEVVFAVEDDVLGAGVEEVVEHYEGLWGRRCVG